MPSSASRFASAITAAGLTVGVAESLTGGALAHRLVDVPGSGDWFAGALVAYVTRVKHELLDVSADCVITEAAAREMAEGATKLLGTDVGISTTGCAGPEPMEDQPVGTVWISVAVPGRSVAHHHCFPGDPETVRACAVRFAFEHAIDAILSLDQASCRR